ncbi:MAG: hypothetical protein HOO91_05010 [Bacteroidales bacterium]|nr:hypothetical protein [Bacteroidales bacterium]
MENQTNRINIDLNKFADQLYGEISSDLKTLQIINDAVKLENYSTTCYTLTQGSLTSTVSVPPIEFLKQRELNKCFKSIISSLQDYMDKLIAIHRLGGEDIIPPSGSKIEDVGILLQSKFAELLLKVSSDLTLNIPKKLEILLVNHKNEEIKVSVQSYFDVRNGLEHHKGIAMKDRLITYKRIAVASTVGYEVIPPVTLGVGEGLILKTFSETVAYDKGGNLIITRYQLNGIILNLLMFVIPTMLEEAVSKLNERRSIL